MNEDIMETSTTPSTPTDEPPTIECEDCWGEGCIISRCDNCGTECESCAEDCITCDGTGEIPNPDYPDADDDTPNTAGTGSDDPTLFTPPTNNTNTQETIK